MITTPSASGSGSSKAQKSNIWGQGRGRGSGDTIATDSELDNGTMNKDRITTSSDVMDVNNDDDDEGDGDGDGDGDDDGDELLYRCWKHQGCGDCLDEENCSWCPFTQSCIPNTHLIPALAPTFNENICPHWSERWEIRTQPLGCQVSTITALTGIISILSTLVFVSVLVPAFWHVMRRVRNINVKFPIPHTNSNSGSGPGFWSSLFDRLRRIDWIRNLWTGLKTGFGRWRFSGSEVFGILRRRQTQTETQRRDDRNSDGHGIGHGIGNEIGRGYLNGGEGVIDVGETEPLLRR